MVRKTLNSKPDVRLDKFLSKSEKNISRTQIQKLILRGKIKVDGFLVKPSFVLKGNEIILIDADIDNCLNEKREYLKKENIPLQIIYEDDAIIIIDKPAGLIVHPGAGNKNGTLLNGLLYHINKLSSLDSTRPGIVHRLDQYTSGIIIIAKTNKAHYFLSEQFAERKINKIYRAIVWGKINNSGIIEGFINRNNKNRISFQMGNKGKYSKSSYKLLKNYGIFSYIEVKPLTGRTHQIRVHMKSIGHPILLDELYSGGKNYINSFHQKHNKLANKIFNQINRFALHAYAISFIHPNTNKQLTFNAPLPLDFNNCLNILEEINE